MSSWSKRTAAAAKLEPEFELLDTGVFNEDRYFDVFVEYAKADVEDILIKITVANRGPEAAPLHLLPTVWFRNTWSWDHGSEPKPALRQSERRDAIELNHAAVWASAGSTARARRSCSSPRTKPTSSGSSAHRMSSPYVKDGINDYVVHGDSRSGQSGPSGHQGRRALCADGPAGRDRHDSAATDQSDSASRLRRSSADFDRIIR